MDWLIAIAILVFGVLFLAVKELFQGKLTTKSKWERNLDQFKKDNIDNWRKIDPSNCAGGGD